MAGFPTPFPYAPLEPAWGLSFPGSNPFDTQPLLQFNNSLKDGGEDNNIDDDDVDVDGLHDAANFILGNTLHYTPHNFHQRITIHYPTIGGCYDNTTADAHKNKRNSDNVISLPVCVKCKKNSKTRDICRIKLAHTEVPWTNSFICITIDESCIADDGTYIIGNDKKLHVVVLSPPSSDSDNEQGEKYVVQSCLESTAPVCSSCKQSNRTKAFCRKQHRHKELPWNTLYVMLRMQTKSGDGSMVTNGALDCLHPLQGCRDVGGRSDVDCNSPSHSCATKTVGDADNERQSERYKQTEPNALTEEFNINCIAPSRTFLSIISSTENSIRWLKRVEPKKPSPQNIDCMSSNHPKYLKSDGGGGSSQCNLNESLTVKRKRKSNKSSSKKKRKKIASDIRDEQQLDNAQLALEAIKHAKHEAKKEQDTARLMRQRLLFTQHPQMCQQEQPQKQPLLIQQQQTVYHLQDTVENQSTAICCQDESYGDDKMSVAETLGKMNEEDEEVKMPSIMNGEDIFDEAAKLAEWF